MASAVNKEIHAVYAAALNTKELFSITSMRVYMKNIFDFVLMLLKNILLHFVGYAKIKNVSSKDCRRMHM